MRQLQIIPNFVEKKYDPGVRTTTGVQIHPFVPNSTRLAPMELEASPNGAPLARIDLELRGPSQSLTGHLIKYRYKYKDTVLILVFV